ncbi:MAG TPA: hypothetical protein PLC58_16990 [Denitromonas sp.]|nr:hypothetical protein [Denitromonas sp.]
MIPQRRGEQMTKAQLLAVGSTAGLEAGGEHDWKGEWDGLTYIGPPNPPPTKMQIAARLRALAAEMDDIAVAMDYYGGLAEWAQHGREIAGAGAIARQWGDEIEASNAELCGGPSGPSERAPG